MGRDVLLREFDCQDCGRRTSVPVLLGRVFGRRCRPCNDTAVAAFERADAEMRERSRAYRRQDWIENPVRGIPARYRGYKWEDFRFDLGGEGNRPSVETLRKYASEFPVDETPHLARSVLLTSAQNGVGKTMLACLFLKEVIDRMDLDRSSHEACPFQFWTVPQLKIRLKNAERYGNPESIQDVYREMETVRLLVLDDVGKENITGGEASFNYEMYFTIINSRYNLGLPMVITSNLNYTPWSPGAPSLLEIMGRAAVSRLVEMTERKVLIIEGEDRR